MAERGRQSEREEDLYPQNNHFYISIIEERKKKNRDFLRSTQYMNIYSLTQTVTQSFCHSLTHSFIHSLSHTLTHMSESQGCKIREESVLGRKLPHWCARLHMF